MNGRTVRAVVGAMFAGIAALPAAAEVYTFSSPNYNSVSGVYTTAMSVSGSITTASPLAANLTASDIIGQIQSYSYFDGIVTLNESNSVICAFDVTTDASGNPTAVDGYIRESATGIGQNTIDFTPTITQAGELGSDLAGNTCGSTFVDTNSASVDVGGTLSASASAAPQAVPSLPIWGLLFASSILAVVGSRRL